PRRCTPWAPQASATSRRSLTTTRVGLLRVTARRSRVTAARSAASRSCSRSWMRSIPAATACSACAMRHSWAIVSGASSPASRRRSVTRQIIKPACPSALPAPPALGGRLVARFARSSLREQQRQVGKAGKQVDNTEAADGAAHEVVGQERAQRRPGECKVVVLPERRPPRQDDQQQPDLDEEDDVEKASEQDLTPRPELWSAGRCARPRRGSR